MVKELASRTLETRFGLCEEHYYFDGVHSYIALVVGDISGQEPVLCRVHSSCMSAHYFNSIECDCREQMELAQERIHRVGRGIIIWLEQEARDNGHLALMLSSKLKAQNVLQTQAYEQLGFPGDARSYQGAAMVLRALKVKAVVLLTNNPAKTEALRAEGIDVLDTLPLLPTTEVNSHLEQLYIDKKNQGHLLARSYDIAVLGDVNVDVITRQNLPIGFGELVENGIVNWGPIDEAPGGTGLNFARFARESGYAVFLIGKVGRDTAGKFLTTWLDREGIAHGISAAETASTGKAVIVRDLHDVRLLIDNAPNANAELDEREVRLHDYAIKETPFAYLSGYAVQQRGTKRYKAACEFMKIAGAAGATLVFDIVPHRIYETYSFRELTELTRAVKVLIAEVATMRRLLGLGTPSEVVDGAVAEQTAAALRERRAYEGFILRYGHSGCDWQIVWDGREEHREDLAHAAAESVEGKRGFGDRMAIDTLRKHFGLRPQAGVVPDSRETE